MKRLVSIRASSLAELFDCPARWEAKHIRGLSTPSTGQSILGKAIHASTAVFDRSRMNQVGITIDEAASAAVDTIYSPQEDVIWQEGETPQEAEKIAVALHTKYCSDIAPHCEYVAVEVKCERLEITGLGIALTGETDRVRKTENGYGISDLKSGKTAVTASGQVKTSGHAYQMGQYEILAEMASGLPITEPATIVGLNTGKTGKAQRIGTAEIHNARDILLGDENTSGVLAIASKLIHSGSFYGNPRSMLCHTKFCPVYKNCYFRR